jgi:hypothetical protein
MTRLLKIAAVYPSGGEWAAGSTAPELPFGGKQFGNSWVEPFAVRQ